MSTTVSPANGSKTPSPELSVHSKLLFVLSATVIVTSWVSFPVMTKGEANAPVATHDPAGMGEELNNGFTTVVAPAGAWPVMGASGTGGLFTSKAQ